MIQHINRGERGNKVRVKLNEVIDFVNAHTDETGGGDSAALLSARVWFALNTLNPSTPDIDIQLFADYGHLRWRISGDIYNANIGSWYGLVIDAFDGADGESRIDVVYAIIPTDLDDHTTGIKIRKGTNSAYASAPALNEDEVFLGYIYLNINGYKTGTGSGEPLVLNVKWDDHEHIVTQEEADGGDFTFEVPNKINVNMGRVVYCNQMPLTLNKGYTVNLETESKEVTILKNNTDETYFAIKAGWPIFVGYYYTKATPGTPENPPEPASYVTLDSVTHQSPDNSAEEYNAANDVKFILTFSNTGSITESLNLRLQLVMSGTGGIIATNDITHAVPVGGNTYEITYKALGVVGSSQEYTLHVSGDRIDHDAVTVPAKVTTWDCNISGASRNTTDTVLVNALIRNTSSTMGNKLIYFQLDSDTKVPYTAYNVAGGEYQVLVHQFTSVSSSAHTITLYDSDQTTVLDTWDVVALAGAGSNILGSESIVSHMTAYHPDGTFYRYSNSSMYINDYLVVGCWYGADNLAVRENYNRCSMSIINIPNKPVVANVKIRLIDDPNYPYTFANLDFLQVHVHNKDLRYVQNYYDYHNAYTVNNILTDTEVIEAAVSESGNREYILTLDGNYFENITTGYFGLLIRSTDESLSAQTFSLWIHDITIN